MIFLISDRAYFFETKFGQINYYPPSQKCVLTLNSLKNDQSGNCEKRFGYNEQFLL